MVFNLLFALIFVWGAWNNAVEKHDAGDIFGSWIWTIGASVFAGYATLTLMIDFRNMIG